MMAEWGGVAIAVVITLALAQFTSQKRWPRQLKRLIYAALAMRVVGALLRHGVLMYYYNGVGDARGYYQQGVEFAARFLRLDFSPFYDSSLWFRGQWRGTSFMPFPSGIVLTFIGPSFRGEFIIFSLFAFLGLVGFAVAFHRSYRHLPVTNYARWIWLFPSLWFWPSSVGKDALILMGLGLAVWGFTGNRGRKNWALFAAGSALIFVIRPQVLAVLLLSLVLAHWLSTGGRWTARRVFQGAVILVVGLGGIVFAMRSVGLERFDLEGLQEYIDAESAAVTSGTTVGGPGSGLSGVPIAILNIIARPFPWEATNIMALASAMEIMGFWALAWYRRRNVMEALRTWKSHPLLRMAVPFILVYSATLGMLIVNLGIIARQRIFLFPFLFLLLEAAPAPEKPRGRSRRTGRRIYR